MGRFARTVPSKQNSGQSLARSRATSSSVASHTSNLASTISKIDPKSLKMASGRLQDTRAEPRKLCSRLGAVPFLLIWRVACLSPGALLFLVLSRPRNHEISFQSGPKMAPKRRNMAASWPKMAPRWLKMAPRWPKMAPRWPKVAPRLPSMAPRWPQDGPKRIQDAPKMAQDGPR